MHDQKTCIIICGPTAVGKTRVAIEIAKHYNAEVISADSRQCYRELNIGVARPSEDELAECTHHFIASHSITENLTAAYFERYALDICDRLFLKNNTVVMVGGTGLYIKAFCEGLDDIPPADVAIRLKVQKGFDEGGIAWLVEGLTKLDPLFLQEGESENPRRMMRALEVALQTGRSILSFHGNKKVERPFSIIKVGLDLPRTELYHRINLRVNEMMQNGLVDEVKKLLPYRHANALQTVGYREIFEYLEGKFNLETAVELIKQNSRHYAKRQLTWFRKDPGVHWFPPDSSMIFNFLKKENAGV